MEFDKKTAKDFAAIFGCIYPEKEECKWLEDKICKNDKSSFRDEYPGFGCNVCGAWEAK